ncbi:MAG: hypothetical protein GY953_09115 [bacterium]|nr:hypothetical protein [bacterium]
MIRVRQTIEKTIRTGPPEGKIINTKTPIAGSFAASGCTDIGTVLGLALSAVRSGLV